MNKYLDSYSTVKYNFKLLNVYHVMENDFLSCHHSRSLILAKNIWLLFALTTMLVSVCASINMIFQPKRFGVSRTLLFIHFGGRDCSHLRSKILPQTPGQGFWRFLCNFWTIPGGCLRVSWGTIPEQAADRCKSFTIFFSYLTGWFYCYADSSDKMWQQQTKTIWNNVVLNNGGKVAEDPRA